MNKLIFPTVEKILLDMDGPLVDDYAMFASLDPHIKDMHAHIDKLKIFGMKQQYMFPLIEQAILKNRFATTPPTLFFEAVKVLLLPYWKELGIEVEILSSTMKHNPNRSSLEEQKHKWLKTNGLDHLPTHLVHGSEQKQLFAKPGVLLIDDYDRTIGQFIKAGGYAIQYTNLNEVMHKLRLIGLAPAI